MAEIKSKYDEATVLKDLIKNKSITIQNKIIYTDDKFSKLGNGTWGKISFLTNYKGYTHINGKPDVRIFNVKELRESFRLSDLVKDAMLNNGGV